MSPRGLKEIVHPRLESGACVRALNFTVRSHRVKIAVIGGTAVVILLIQLFASARVVRSEVHSRLQKTAWLLLVWLAPLVGAIWAIQTSTEKSVPAPVPGSLEEGPRPGMESGGSGYI
jgi:Phospholipase_D-nuclease N-terminal